MHKIFFLFLALLPLVSWAQKPTPEDEKALLETEYAWCQAYLKGDHTALAELHDGQRVHFLDINAKFLTPDGTLPKDIMPDALHPGLKGYEIWADAIKEPLARLLK